MNSEPVAISRIVEKKIQKSVEDSYAVVWIKDQVNFIEIDGVTHKDVSNSIFFLDSRMNWKILREGTSASSGYVLSLSKEVLDEPVLSSLHINEVRFFNSGLVPRIKLSPGIERRIESILEMLDELIASSFNQKEAAIISLLNTFFVYCDGKCNIKSAINGNNSKTSIVYKFKKLVDKLLHEHHEVNDYAQLLNISPKYLNECVRETLTVNAKNVIIEQLLMRSRHALKFSDKSIKEISFELGFSSPEYFGSFFKYQTGLAPSALRKV